MADFASIAGVRIVSGSLAIPLFGLWAADLSLATTDNVPANATVAIGNMSLVGHVYRQAQFGGERKVRVVAGFGGWRQPLPARHYQLSGGIKLSLVLRDAALEVGEQINIPNDSTIGSDYVREAAPASRVLRQLAGPDWYVDPTGVTQIRPWPTTQVTSDYTIESRDGGAGLVVVATEDLASWLPGSTFSNQFTNNATVTNRGVRFRFDDGGTLRLEVLT